MSWACMVKTVVSTHWLKRSTILSCMDCPPSMVSYFIIGYNGVRIIQKEKTLVFIVFDFMPVIYLSLLQPGDYLAVTLTGSIFLMNYHTLVTMTVPAVTAGQTEYP